MVQGADNPLPQPLDRWYAPGMKRTTIRVRLPNTLLRAAERIAQAEQWALDAVIETALDEFQQRRDRVAQWNRLQQAAERRSRRSGTRPPTMGEIDREIHAYRAEQHRGVQRSSRH